MGQERRGGSISGMLVLMLLLALPLVAFGRAQVEHALRNPGATTWESLTITTVLVVEGIVFFRVLVAVLVQRAFRRAAGAAGGTGSGVVGPRSGGPTAPMTLGGLPTVGGPQAIGDAGTVGSGQVTGSTVASTTSSSPAEPAAKRRHGGGHVWWRFVPHLVAGGTAIVVAGVHAAHGFDTVHVKVPSFSTKGVNGCPAASAGATIIDSARTDCAPISAARFFGPPGASNIQHDPYELVRSDDAPKTCERRATDADAAALLAAAGCTDVLRVLLVRPDHRVAADAELVVTPSAARAKDLIAKLAQLRGADRNPVVPLQPDVAAAQLPRGFANVTTNAFCASNAGRYVVCVHVVGSASAPAVPATELTTAARDAAFLAIDPVNARIFG